MIAAHVAQAVRQFRKGELIGRRQTPAISFWPMRQKWDKWGDAWLHGGTDGDTLMEGGMVVCPASLEILFVRFGDVVGQFVFVSEEEAKFRPGQEDKPRFQRYEAKRMTWPRSI